MKKIFLIFLFLSVSLFLFNQWIFERRHFDASFPVIDAHTHTDFDGRPERSSQRPFTRDQYLKELKEIGAVGAVSHISSTGAGYDSALDGDGVIFCRGVGEKIDLGEIEMGLQQHRYACIKIYLGYTYRYASDREYLPIYRLAEKYDVPVVFHTGDTYSPQGKLKYADPLTVDEVAVDFPRVTFVIAHMGNPWIQSAAEVAYKNENVFLDLSALVIGESSRLTEVNLEKNLREPIRWVLGYIEDPSKLLFGTDWPLVGMKDYFEAVKPAIPREHWCDVFFNNAVRVFRMKKISEKVHCKIEEGP